MKLSLLDHGFDCLVSNDALRGDYGTFGPWSRAEGSMSLGTVCECLQASLTFSVLSLLSA